MEAESSRSREAATDVRSALILALAVVVSILAYLLASGLTYRLGFPLDDAWIHQTYARNLALRGEWAFTPGQPSGGSTSPLWSALLAIGYVIGLPPLVWTFLLGGLTLWSLTLTGERLVRRVVPGYSPRWPWVGLFLACEWHLVWAAVSGMETLLHALLVTIILGLLMAETKRYLGLGLLTGLCVWIRPDGLTLLAPIGLTILMTQPAWRLRLGGLLKLLFGFAILFLPYLLFNLAITGTPWPNTFYAKQAEYADLLAQPVLQRLLAQGLLPLVGAGIILLPGAVRLSAASVRGRLWGHLAGMAWFLGYLALYALRLPVTYQHGRYAMPAMPIFFVWGLIGVISWKPPAALARRARLWVFAWRTCLVAVLLLFWLLGARTYAQDVAVIESEMVVTARWVAQNIPDEAIIAAHDIGALGYFGGHRVLDLAGLASPDVVPFIRDEARLAAYLDRRDVQYLVTFPGWYPRLVQRGALVFTTGGEFAPALGGENMAVYRWLPAK